MSISVIRHVDHSQVPAVLAPEFKFNLSPFNGDHTPEVTEKIQQLREHLRQAQSLYDDARASVNHANASKLLTQWHKMQSEGRALEDAINAALVEANHLFGLSQGLNNELRTAAMELRTAKEEPMPRRPSDKEVAAYDKKVAAASDAHAIAKARVTSNKEAWNSANVKVEAAKEALTQFEQREKAIADQYKGLTGELPTRTTKMAPAPKPAPKISGTQVVCSRRVVLLRHETETRTQNLEVVGEDGKPTMRVISEPIQVVKEQLTLEPGEPTVVPAWVLSNQHFTSLQADGLASAL
jgi:DNA repair exonuclease SbcCD ATPase subunit